MSNGGDPGTAMHAPNPAMPNTAFGIARLRRVAWSSADHEFEPAEIEVLHWPSCEFSSRTVS